MSSSRALVIPLGEDVYAIGSDQVREVVADPHPTPVPSAPPWVLGLINVRGEVLPLLDTAVLLHVGATPELRFAVIVNSSLGPAAFSTTAIPQFGALGDDLGNSDLPGTSKRFRLGERVVVRLDVDALLAAARDDTSPLTASTP